jgi:hypothetical protein
MNFLKGVFMKKLDSFRDLVVVFVLCCSNISIASSSSGRLLSRAKKIKSEVVSLFLGKEANGDNVDALKKGKCFNG